MKPTQKNEKPKGKFTDKYIRSLKPYGQIEDIREGDGFGVRVLPSGMKTFFFIYRFDGKRRFLNLGHYDPNAKPAPPDKPPTPGTLAYARDKYKEAWSKVYDGHDPLEQKRQKAVERQIAPTVSDLCREFLEDVQNNKRDRTWKEYERIINHDILPLWKDRKVQDITRRDIVIMIDGISGRGKLVMSNRTRTLISTMFKFAVEKAMIELTPFVGIKKPPKEKPKDRALSEDEIRILWSALEGEGLIMTGDIGRALKLILLTAQRPGEVVGMHKSEITGNWWTIPAERAKNDRKHRVYLTTMALEIIGTPYGYVFPSPKQQIINEGTPEEQGSDVPITEAALSCALRRNIKGEKYRQDKSKQKYTRGPYTTAEAQPVNRIGVDFFTPHDLRRTAATLMSEIGEMDEVIDAILNHKKQGVIKVYNQNRYDREKQTALESWERKLTQIITGGGKDNVVSINVARGKAV